jgi:sec-independent protein translocase protein TatA
MQPAMLGFISSMDMTVIGIVFLVLFGAKRVPELMKGLGTGLREFKKASREVQWELERVMHEEPRPAKPAIVEEIHSTPAIDHTTTAATETGASHDTPVLTTPEGAVAQDVASASPPAAEHPHAEKPAEPAVHGTV